MSKISFHKSFQLDGSSFSSDQELLNHVKDISNSMYVFLSDWFSPEDFVIVQTSGSTGKPKPIPLKKRFMQNSAKATGEFFNLSEKTTALLCLSTDYIAGKMMLVRALTLGWHIDMVAPTSEVKIEKEYDFSAMVPLQLRNSLSQIPKIRKLIVGGGVVTDDLIQQIQRVPTEIFATYGMTETITHIAVKKINHCSNSVFYKVLPNITITKDSRNCLCIQAPNLSDEDIIRTNDVVDVISDSQFEWLGRYDNVINSGGIKLHPEQIETKLSKWIEERFFVTGVKDTLLGEKLILIIEGEKRFLSFDTIPSLSKYEYPKQVYFLPKFKETKTKKIQRKKTLDLIRF